MEFKWMLIAFAVTFCSAFVGMMVQDYNNNQKAMKAMELGLQECTELDTNERTIIVYKKECK